MPAGDSNVIYVRTADGVVLRFSSYARIKAWLDQGKLAEEDLLLTKEGVWRPLKKIGLPERVGGEDAHVDAGKASAERERPTARWEVQSTPTVNLHGPEPGPVQSEPQTGSEGLDGSVFFVENKHQGESDDDWWASDPSALGGKAWSKRVLLVLTGLLVLVGGAALGYKTLGLRPWELMAIKTSSKRGGAGPAPDTAGRPLVSRTDAMVGTGIGDAGPSRYAEVSETRDPGVGLAGTPGDVARSHGDVPKPVGALKPSVGAGTDTKARRARFKAQDSAGTRKKAIAQGARPPDSYDRHMQLARRLLRRDPSRAMAHFQYALNERPRSVEALYGVGSCLLRMGSTRQAMQYFQRALRIVPDYGPAIIGMARAKEAQGDRAAARFFYKHYLHVEPYGSMAREAQKGLDRLR